MHVLKREGNKSSLEGRMDFAPKQVLSIRGMFEVFISYRLVRALGVSQPKSLLGVGTKRGALRVIRPRDLSIFNVGTK